MSCSRLHASGHHSLLSNRSRVAATGPAPQTKLLQLVLQLNMLPRPCCSLPGYSVATGFIKLQLQEQPPPRRQSLMRWQLLVRWQLLAHGHQEWKHHKGAPDHGACGNDCRERERCKPRDVRPHAPPDATELIRALQDGPGVEVCLQDPCVPATGSVMSRHHQRTPLPWPVACTSACCDSRQLAAFTAHRASRHRVTAQHSVAAAIQRRGRYAGGSLHI